MEATAELIVEAGAKLDERDHLARTPLHNAAIYNLDGVATLLIERGASVNPRDYRDNTPLTLANADRSLRTQSLATARVLRAKGGVPSP